MAMHTYNQIGSTEVTIPNEINVNDRILFNITNTDIKTKYSGTMLTYTFPFNCKARLDAYGARGGKGNRCTDEQVGKGARVSGVINFTKGDELLICVGQAGTVFASSVSDGTSGAGGGGTFVVVKADKWLDATDIYRGEGVGNSRYIKPLIVGAGGNGGRDVGYSGASTVYHGLYISDITSNLLKTYAGGGYSQSHTTTDAGKSFLIRAKGATANYTRSSTSYAGFGGGGGGYYKGSNTRSATSYVNPLVQEQDGEDGVNFGEGKLIIEFLEIPVIDGYCKINNEYRKIETISVKVDNEWSVETVN